MGTSAGLSLLAVTVGAGESTSTTMKVSVGVVAERVQYYGRDGKLITESLRDYSKKAVVAEYKSLDGFLKRWKEAERKKAVTDELLDRAAHDAVRVYPDLNVALVPSATVLMLGLPVGLRLVVDNAIANAVKHGGATRILLSADSSAAGVEIVVDDNGTGVPEEERQAVFERFARGSTATRSGSGLGLALVAQQAELHGGTAALEASPLGGTRLVLRLPGTR